MRISSLAVAAALLAFTVACAEEAPEAPAEAPAAAPAATTESESPSLEVRTGNDTVSVEGSDVDVRVDTDD